MRKHIILIEKKLDALNFIEILEKKYHIIHHPANETPDTTHEEPFLVLVNVHLETPDNTRMLREVLEVYDNTPKLFLVSDLYGPAATRASKLGADRVLLRPYATPETAQGTQEFKDLEAAIKSYLKQSLPPLWPDIPQADRMSLQRVEELSGQIIDSIICGQSIPKDEVSSSCDQLIHSMSNASIGPWLDAVKSHHSYTLRHCITVTGLSIAFGKHFNMQKHDLKQLAAGALMHDIGKVKIPLAILDKPGKLDMDEMELIRKHPEYSAEILREDGQFDDFTIELALRHHELLDGSGYPDGLSNNEICDSVRMLTIIDIFSALVDQRSYKKSMTGEQAYDMMCKMEGMLDQELLRAFKPIALDIKESQSA